MKKIMLTFFLLLAFFIAQAQERPVMGKVTASDTGQPIPGVSVLVKETTVGTVTDLDGTFRLDVPATASILVFSYLGYASQERTVGNEGVVNVTLTPEVEDLSEVVVTAFGLEREKKSLTYAVQDVSSKEMSEARELNVLNSLSGKVAGLSVTRSGSGVGSESRVVMRGDRSINGNSQPLYIVDGVPAAGISTINPDDIASINVLKGPNAAALYGSRANNGAIIVSTKRGSADGFSASLNTSFMIDEPILLTNYQNIYGQGSGGQFSPSSEFSWGPRMDGSSVDNWSRAEGPPSTVPYSPQPNNVRDFFQTGHNLATTLSIGGGNEKNRTYFSYTFTNADGVVPKNSLNRHSVNLRITNNLTDRLTLDGKINYIREDIDNPLAQGEDFSNPIRHAYRIPRNIRTEDLAQYEYYTQTGLIRQNYFNPGSNGGANPYWTINRNLRANHMDRVVAFTSLNYTILEGLNILARASLDRITRGNSEKMYADTYVLAQNGRFTVGKEESMEINTDFLITYDKALSEDWHLNLTAGGNSRINRNSSLSSNTGSALTVPNLFFLANTQQVVSTHGVGLPKNVNSLFGSAQFGWKNSIFLDVAARNDWSSTLPKQNWSFFYPTVGLNVVVSDLVNLPGAFTFVKFRGNFAEVGNDTDPYQLHRTATIAAGGRGGYLSLNTVLPNEDLLPEKTRSIELGADLRFFDDRLGIDFTYYKTNSFNQLFSVSLPVGSGASSYFTNGGEVQNKGIEAMISLSPIRRTNFTWDITANFAKNNSLVKEITDESPSLTVGSDFLRQYRVEAGKPFGEVYSRGFQRDDQGRVIIGVDGLPKTTPGFTVRVANYNPIWIGGMQNSFSFKNFRANFTIDFRQGGSIASLTNAIIYADGLTKETLDGRDGGLIFGENFFDHETAVLENGAPNDIRIDAEKFWVTMGGRNAPIGEVFSVSATNIRLREAVIGYTIPAEDLSALPFKSISINFVARNLFFILNEAKNIDPDVIVGTAATAAGFDSFGPPTSRSYGFNLNIGF
jgi:TonB-linked SusC/RagA family outer membrane protein